MNELVSNFLNEYYINPDPQYAVFLKGKWGCGKTHFIKKWLEKYQVGVVKEEADIITLEPIYISLYGLNTIGDIKTAIDREINPFFYSKTGKIFKGLASVLGKIVLRTSFDFNNDEKEDASFSGSIDSLSVFHSKDDVITGTKFIVFDDIERSQIDIKSLLGFINYFVEHCDCHVIVIGDETQIDSSNKKVLDEFKEKTIGREFIIYPDISNAVVSFLTEPYFSSYLATERDYIEKCFRSAGNDNLRILRQCLMDFSTQIVGLEESVWSGGNLFLHGLLGSFIAVYAELNNKDNRSVFSDFAKFYQIAVSGLGGEDDKQLRALIQKYNEVSQDCLYHVLSVEYVHSIVRHITKGIPLDEYIRRHINDSKRSYNSWEKLSGFWELENRDFLALYLEVTNALLNDEIQLPYQIGTTLGYLAYFDAVGVKVFTQSNLRKAKRKLRARINAEQDLESLYQLRASLLQGMHYIGMSEPRIEMRVMSECDKTIQSAFEKRRRVLPDEMQIALRTLSEDNVYSLGELDEKTYPDHSSTYQMRAIFEHENPQALFERICSLTNKGKNQFCSFLSTHYLFGTTLNGFGNIYAADKKVLLKLEALMKEKLATENGVDKLAYQRLDEALNKAILRTEGKAEV